MAIALTPLSKEKLKPLPNTLEGCQPIEVAAHQIQDSDKQDRGSTNTTIRKGQFCRNRSESENQRSWFLKQNEELLKLLDCLHKQEYDEVVQEEEILDRISDFTLVLFEYVKTLKKRKGRGAVCV